MSSFEDRLREELEKQGVTRGPDGHLSRMPAFTGPSKITDEQIRYINGRKGTRGIQPIQRCRWVENLAQLVNVLDEQGAESDPSYAGLFWIKLHGTIVEVREDVVALFHGQDPEKLELSKSHPLSFARNIIRRIDDVRGRLTEDELVYADYYRQTQCHPTQESYALRWSKKGAGSVLDRRRVTSIDKEYTIDQVNEIIDRILLSFGCDEHAAAVDFARKIRPALPQLVHAMRVFIGEAYG